MELGLAALLALIMTVGCAAASIYFAIAFAITYGFNRGRQLAAPQHDWTYYARQRGRKALYYLAWTAIGAVATAAFVILAGGLFL